MTAPTERHACDAKNHLTRGLDHRSLNFDEQAVRVRDALGKPTLVVGEFGTVPLGQVQRDLAGRAATALREIASREFPEIVPVSVKVRKGAAFDEIVRAAGDWDADLILIATHGRAGVKRALLGSTADLQGMNDDEKAEMLKILRENLELRDQLKR